MKYLLSDGTLTDSKYAYINDAVMFAFSLDQYSVPNSNIGLHLTSNEVTARDQLVMNTLVKNIDSSLSVESLVVNGEDINLTLKYPYGLIRAVL